MDKNGINERLSPSSVGITGMGILSAAGQGVAMFESALRNGQSAFNRSCHFPTLSFPIIVATLKEFHFEQALDSFSSLPESLISRARKAGLRAPLVIQTSLIAALEAWQHAQLHLRQIEGRRVGLIVAGHNTTQRYQNIVQDKFQQEPAYLPPSYGLHFMDTDQVGTLSHVLGITGEGFTVGGASASGNMGIIQGYRLIQQRYVDVCVIVGVLADLSLWELQGFHNIGALGGWKFRNEPAKACRPFDRDREGFIWGQASGCLILESREHVKTSDVSLVGEISSVAMNMDGNRLANPSLLGETHVMQQALKNARMQPKDIQYINAHGSSSALGDETEVAAIRAVFGTEASQIWLNSTKSVVGHCLWSAGLVEAIATLLQLQGGFVHANLNLEHPIDNICRFVGAESEAIIFNAALSNSFGFGGINTSIIFSREGML